MASPVGSMTGSVAGDGSANEKPRLTEKEKKQNHIASEQKRRLAIREAFDKMTTLIPGMEGQGRSEGLVLSRAVVFMREKVAERQALIQAIEQKGGHVSDEMRKQIILHNPHNQLNAK